MGVAAFVEHGLPGWLRFAMVLTDDAWEAEDLCSEVVGRVFEQWSRVSAAQLPNAYVKRMIVNQIIETITVASNVSNTSTWFDATHA